MVELGPREGIDQRKAPLNKEREKFLGALSRQVIAGLEEDPKGLDFLQEDTSPETMRKLQEAIELAERENKELAGKLRDIKREVYTGLESKETPKWLKDFSEEQRIILAQNLDHIELTQGCSLACPHCGAEAKHGVRSYMAFSDLIYFAKNYGKYCKEPPTLYFASEPLD